MKRRRCISLHGRVVHVELETEWWTWLAEISAETGQTQKQFWENARIRHPKDRLHNAVRMEIAAHFHGGDQTIYRCLSHLVPQRNGDILMTFGARGKGKRKRAARNQTAAVLSGSGHPPRFRGW